MLIGLKRKKVPMTTQSAKLSEPEQLREEEEASTRHLKEAGGAVAGAVGGAGLGVLAGPPGVAAGAVIGAVAGTLTAWAMDAQAAETEAADKELDKDIGVDGGDIGTNRLEHPPARVAAPSAAAAGSAGASADDTVSAAGPIGAPPEEE